MSTAVAMALSPAPHDRPSSYGSDLPPPASATTSPAAQRTAAAAAAPPPATSSSDKNNAPQPRSGSGSPRGSAAAPSAQKSSPPSASRTLSGPKIVVKQEPGSPGLQTSRHRPRKLDLSKNTTNIVSPATGRPLTARDSALAIQEVGLACLSPGFVPKDAQEQEQLNRSMSVREQQRQIIEARLQQQSAKLGDNGDKDKDGPGHHFAAKTPGLARKRGAPPGLSIVAPPHEQFANERVIQSAPLGQTFTGRHNPHPLTRHITNQPSNLSSTSHIHHVPANQTNNRLPPLADVFGQNLAHPEPTGHGLYSSQSRAPLPSPHHPPPPQSTRPREYKSAEEAQVELAGGRPELLPNSRSHSSSSSHHHHHPPPPHHTAPTPHTTSNNAAAVPPPSGSHKRRRAEYEEGGSPPLGNGGRPAPAMPHVSYGPGPSTGSASHSSSRRGPFGEGRDSPETIAAKKEEFLALCARAWDLFHS
ncbi:hypothetical protein VTJ83DRAFT_2570 [Remersonia thermophila]|uniref:Uncharacterized protein n=1 Tax=Remersonia thermophila TaxID=72144 RepID=A0ABR4DJD8_9PEZI